eukprot:gene2907-16155_t
MDRADDVVAHLRRRGCSVTERWRVAPAADAGIALVHIFDAKFQAKAASHLIRCLRGRDVLGPAHIRWVFFVDGDALPWWHWEQRLEPYTTPGFAALLSERFTSGEIAAHSWAVATTTLGMSFLAAWAIAIARHIEPERVNYDNGALAWLVGELAAELRGAEAAKELDAIRGE